MTNQTITPKESEAVREIRNSIMHFGRVPSMRELMSTMGYKSPRSTSLLIENLVKKGILRRKEDGALMLAKNVDDDTSRAQTVDVPLIGTIACGMPIMAEENIQCMIPVSVKLARPLQRYFILKAKGDSMDQAGIKDGDLVLVQQQNIANNGSYVVALIDDKATIKEFHRAGDTVQLKPKSSNKKHQPIILTKDFQIQGIVMTVIPKC